MIIFYLRTPKGGIAFLILRITMIIAVFVGGLCQLHSALRQIKRPDTLHALIFASLLVVKQRQTKRLALIVFGSASTMIKVI
jgi:hypothetical protein